MKHEELFKLLTFMADIYPTFTFPKDQSSDTQRFVKSWKKYLGGFSYDIAQKALDKVSRNDSKQWPPSAPQLRGEAESIKGIQDRLREEQAMYKMIENGNHPKLEPSDILPGGLNEHQN